MKKADTNPNALDDGKINNTLLEVAPWLDTEE